MTTTADRQPLTDRQREVLDFIAANMGLFGPSIREIAAGLGGISANAVVGHVKALERKGYVIHHPRKTRGIEVVR